MKENKTVKIKIVPDPTIETPYPRIYSNYVAVQSTPFDFTLRFCDAVPIFDQPKGGAEIVENHVPIIAEIVLPVAIFPSLIDAMKQQYDNYLKTYAGPNEKKK